MSKTVNRIKIIIFVAPCSSKSFNYDGLDGVLLNHIVKNMQCTYTLAAKTVEGVDISKCLYFDPNSNGEIPWKQLEQNGRFDKIADFKANHYCDEMACGIAAQLTANPSDVKTIEMCLVWDMPVVNFSMKLKKYKRFYTKHFGEEGASGKIAEYALQNYAKWETEIYKWQSKVLDDRYLYCSVFKTFYCY